VTTAIESSSAATILLLNGLTANSNGTDSFHKEAERLGNEQDGAQSPPRGVRHRLSTERISLTHHFTIAGQDGYITVGLFPDSQPGEIFINIAKEGSTLGGLMNSFAEAISTGLQYGVPLKLFCQKFSHTRFEPSGWTSNPEIGFAKSIMDYISGGWSSGLLVVQPTQSFLMERRTKEKRATTNILPMPCAMLSRWETLQAATCAGPFAPGAAHVSGV